jgi:hypothetical protein
MLSVGPPPSTSVQETGAVNRATRANVATLGTIFGLSGMNHGFFETLQGNVATGGLFISAIGEAQKMWPHGDEAAFTLIPNFLLTGIAAMLIGLALVVWSVGFVHKKKGPTVFILLFILLLVVGGGVAQLLFFPFLWLVATRINQPLAWWRSSLSGPSQARLAKCWPSSLVISAALLLLALAIATTGFVPGLGNPDTVLAVMLACLGAVVVLIPVAFVSGFAHDIAMRPAIAREDGASPSC